MIKVYIVLWRGQYGDWSLDSMETSREAADAKVRYESLRHPSWEYAIVEGDVPCRKTEGSVAA